MRTSASPTSWPASRPPRVRRRSRGGSPPGRNRAAARSGRGPDRSPPWPGLHPEFPPRFCHCAIRDFTVELLVVPVVLVVFVEPVFGPPVVCVLLLFGLLPITRRGGDCGIGCKVTGCLLVTTDE